MTQCVNNAGVPKVRFDTRAAARARLTELLTEGAPLNGCKPYRCRVCGWFHLGHYPPPDLRGHLRNRHRTPDTSLTGTDVLPCATSGIVERTGSEPT